MRQYTYHLPRKPTAELPPVRALRREPRPVRRGVVVRPGVVALGARPLRGQTGLAISPRPGEPYLDSIRLQRAEGRELDGAVDDMGRTRAERRAWASVLRGFGVALAVAACPLPAAAVCGGHQTQIVATPEGAIGLCPQDHDAAGEPVGAGYYRQCDVRAAWAGGSATVTVIGPVPGAVVAVGFAAASGPGGATATCTNADGAESPIAASAITFRTRLPLPVPPAMEVAP